MSFEITYKQVPYYVHPSASASKIGVIVLQEWWGLNQHIKNQTDRISTLLNATAISPDLYRGKCADKPDEANHLMSSLDWPGALNDIANACDYLKEKGCTKIGVVGFCMGGALSFASAIRVPAIDCAVCFYGIPPQELADPKELNKPVQFHFGDLDMSPGFSDIEAADKLRDVIKSAGIKLTEFRHTDHKVEFVNNQGIVAEFHRYADGNHAFMNSEAPAYPFNVSNNNKEAVSKLATEHMLKFFKDYLQ